MSDDEINLLADSLKNVKSKVQHCEICGYLCENEICNICADKSRDHNLICVIEDYKSAVSFEKIGKIGRAHV